MSDLDLCKTRLEGIVKHTSSGEKLLIKVQEFIVHRMPEETADRVAFREWAEAELTKLEERAPGGGVIKIGTAPIAKTGRRMCDAGDRGVRCPDRCRTRSIETCEGPDRPVAISGSGLMTDGAAIPCRHQSNQQVMRLSSFVQPAEQISDHGDTKKEIGSACASA
jgi:hypothetical protein